MKRILLLPVLFLIILASCNKETVNPPSSSLEGVYKGSFIRLHPTIRYAPAEVTLSINGNRFTGTSDTPKYPAICSGSFKAENQKLVVTNECFFTADFDWTFIFNGDYEVAVSGNELKITKAYPGNVFDQYIFQKQ